MRPLLVLHILKQCFVAFIEKHAPSFVMIAGDRVRKASACRDFEGVIERTGGERRGRITPQATRCRTATNLAAARAPPTYSRRGCARAPPPPPPPPPTPPAGTSSPLDSLSTSVPFSARTRANT
ncbi:hypothetical protein RR48_15154 [Papilio machaon]|uniref:Uncharacterized protein n=1 Tax=Papilio machaon TaxID=76193 RepID=A0A194QU06_PAPMA|nr:hypothetical protein RR48_15154 [Papilio machaon]